MALGGTATQSETVVNPLYFGSPFVASHANDGNFDAGVTTSSGECSITVDTPPVWRQVDLLEVYEITKVAINGKKEGSKS